MRQRNSPVYSISMENIVGNECCKTNKHYFLADFYKKVVWLLIHSRHSNTNADKLIKHWINSEVNFHIFAHDQDNMKYKKQLIDKQIIWSLPLSLSVMFLSFNLYVYYFGQDNTETINTPFFSKDTVYVCLGWATALIGLMSFTSTAFILDVYGKSKDSYLFKHYQVVLLFKIFITFFGLTLIALGEFNSPHVDRTYELDDYLTMVLAFLFAIAIVYQIYISIRNQIKNRNDFVLIETASMKWFDDHSKSIFELPFSEIESVTRIYEVTDKYPEVIGLSITTNNFEELKINLENMSLVPQGKFICDVLAKKVRIS